MKTSYSLLIFLLFCSLNKLFAQNSLTGDGFGGRGWYVEHNYQVGAYSAYTVCGDSSQLYGWGKNFFGQLGDGTYISAVNPVKAIGVNQVKFFTAGYISAVIKTDNTVWVWGLYGGFTPIAQKIMDSVRFVDGGSFHIVFVKTDGTVWGAGNNSEGELGNGSFLPGGVNSPPVQMLGVANAVRAIAIGETVPSATIILLSNGTVKITGGGGWFQPTISPIPTTMAGLSNIVDIKGNSLAAYALDSAGNVFSFGSDNSTNPVLGLGNHAAGVIPPTKIIFPASAAPIVALSANTDGYSALALDSNHNAYAWGNNKLGQLGDGTVVSKPTPTLVATNVIDIFAGEDFSYILKADNTLWATGFSGNGDPGEGSIWMNLSNTQRNVFTQIDPTIPPMNLCAAKPYGILPIQLLNFTGKAEGNTANLTWASADEINFYKYVLQYSQDGTNFSDLAIIYGNGSNSKYHYLHQQVNGNAFYRLKMIDRNGGFKYSEIRFVRLHNKTSFISIIPNPAKAVVSIYISNRTDINSLQLISIEGKILRIIKNYISGQEINLNNFKNGIYIVKSF